MRVVVALFAGGLFGLGLIVSDMIDPARVLGFLDIASGAWDPTLAFVMGGALVPMLVAWRRVARLVSHGETPPLDGAFPAPPTTRIDARLLAGGAVFGLGWGLVGFCPGPALSALGVSLVTPAGWPIWLFAAAMMCGMGAYRMLPDR
jgi:hypothetical protein